MILLQKIKKFQTKLETSGLEITDENLQRAYIALANLELIPKCKVMFDENLTGRDGKPLNGQVSAKKKRFLGVIPYGYRLTIRIRPGVHWLEYLFHEFTHVCLFKDFSYTKHGAAFNDIQEYLLDRHSEKLLKLLLKLQKEDKENAQATDIKFNKQSNRYE